MIGIEKQLKELTAQIIDNSPTPRQLAEIRELYAQLDDYYNDIQEAIFDGSLKLDESVIVKIDNISVKFSDMDKAAEFIDDHIRQ